MTNISTVDELVQALWDAQDATEPVSLILTSLNYDLSSSSFERDERFGYDLTESCLPHITTDVTIDVDTALPFVTIYQDNPMYRLFYVAQGGNLTLSHLECRGGDVGALDTGGGAIFNEGTLTVSHCRFSENKSNYGGAILNMRGQTNIFNCDFFDNAADWGGALYNGSVANGCVMNVIDSRIHNNRAQQSWAVGGGITNFGTLTVQHCMIKANQSNLGGGIANWANNAHATVEYSHITYNAAGNRGGGVLNEFGTLQVNCSTLIGNTATSGKQAYESGGTLSLNKVALPSNPPAINDVPSNVSVTGTRPLWYPEFIMERDTLTKKLIPTYLYNTQQRQQLSKFATAVARSNFDNFATSLTGNNLGSGTNAGREQIRVNSIPDTSSVGGRINYSAANVLAHVSSTSPSANSTGSSIFVSEMLHLGGAIPMVKDINGSAACPGGLTPPANNGWRACIDGNSRSNSTTQTWKDHDELKQYFAAQGNGYAEGTITFDQFNGDLRLNLTTFAGTINSDVGNLRNFQDKMYAIFERPDLSTIQTGDYVYLNLGQGSVSHGFLIVGWGPAVECPPGLNSLEVGFANPFNTVGEYQLNRKTGTIPYVVDLAYSYNAIENKTGWFEDPRPRPFYCSSVIISASNTAQMNPILSRLGPFSSLADYLAKLRNQYQAFRTGNNANPNWLFVHIPTQLPAKNGIVSACV